MSINIDPKHPVLMSAYYIANLLNALKDVKRNGDWWWEIQYHLYDAWIKLGKPELRDNDGNVWTGLKREPGGEVWNHESE
jgi:hypothetical protein